MRMKIIKRFSAATVGVCFTYALIRLPFSMINSESQTMSEWATSPSTAAATTQPATQPTTAAQATQGTTRYDITEPTTVPTEPDTTAPVTEVITEQYATEEIITNDYSQIGRAHV